MTCEVLDAFLKLTTFLVNLPTGGALLKHLFDHILFNPALWVYSPIQVHPSLSAFPLPLPSPLPPPLPLLAPLPSPLLPSPPLPSLSSLSPLFQVQLRLYEYLA